MVPETLEDWDSGVSFSMEMETFLDALLRNVDEVQIDISKCCYKSLYQKSPHHFLLYAILLSDIQ